MSARTTKNHPWIVLCIASLLILSLTAIGILCIHPEYPTRIGVAIVGNPTIVFSYDPVRQTLAAIRIPSDVSVDVTRGYGVYPLSSVWQLDSIDKRGGQVYTETLEELVGIPIRFYIRPTHDMVGSDQSIESEIQDALSLPSCIQAFIQKNRTNMPLWLLFTLSRASQDISPTGSKVFDLGNLPVFSDATLPDGTSSKKIDSGKLGLVIGTHAEDAKIRKENLRLAVYNTTDSPGLAQKAARVMEQIGFHVVTIANDQRTKPSRCLVRGNESVSKTDTVKTLLWLYGCTFENNQDESQNDVTLFVGTDFEKRFLPYK